MGNYILHLKKTKLYSCSKNYFKISYSENHKTLCSVFQSYLTNKQVQKKGDKYTPAHTMHQLERTLAIQTFCRSDYSRSFKDSAVPIIKELVSTLC